MPQAAPEALVDSVLLRAAGRQKARALGRDAAVSLSPATDGTPEPILIVRDPMGNAM